jgi:UDP-N-acetylmuramate--alanine ligase
MTTYTPPLGSIPTLPVPSLEGVTRVHLIGIGGAGMRNLARLLLATGVSVTGSDMKDSRGRRGVGGPRCHAGRDAGCRDHLQRHP